MSYRMFVGAGIAVGMTAATALAQLPQQQQQRPGANQTRQLLQDLEGNWDVDVRIWSIQDAQRTTRPGMQQPGTQPGQQPNVQRIQQQIQQTMTQAGVSQAEAQLHAQNLARQFTQERPQQQQIQQRLVDVMTQAGVDRQQAQTQAQRLAQQIHQQLQQPADRPGIRPEDDDTTSPFDRDRDRVRTGTDQYGEATLRAEGSSSRSWVLDENILEEEVDFSMTSEAPEDRPGQMQQFGRERDLAIQKLKDGETLEGRGMFGFDDETGNLYHVWADNSKGKIYFSVGEYDAQRRTVTFHTADAREIMNGMNGIRRPTEPGIRPGQPRPGEPGMRPGTPPDREPGDQPGASLIQQPGQQPGMQRPGQQLGQHDKPRVVLRIVSNDEHVVEYYRESNPTGPAVRTMVITYTRNNG